MLNKQRGFTLVEIAIVLVIIGLLLGGTLKGQAMIDNSRFKRLVSDLDAFRAQVYMFQDRYGALPGDMGNAAARLNALAPNGNGDGIVSGNTCNNAGDETCVFWQHLRYAGLLSGDPAITSTAARVTDHPYGAVYDSIYQSATGNGRFELKIFMTNMPGDAAQRLDDETDDGNPATGDVINDRGRAYNPANRSTIAVTL